MKKDKKNNLHKTLKRQLKRIGSNASVVTQIELENFIEKINLSYHENEKARRQYEHSMQLMSNELIELNEKIKSDAENLVQLEKKRSTLALEATNDYLWDWNIEAGIVYVNTILKKRLGFKSKVFSDVDKDWVKTIHKEDLRSVLKESKNYLNGVSDKFEVEQRLIDKDGNVFWVLNRGKIIESNEAGKPVRMIGTFVDITRTKVLEFELKKSKKDADKANQAKSEFLANMSHEIRTPMNGIIGMTQNLKSTNLSSEQTTHLTYIEKSSQALLRIINNILDLSKIEAGCMELESVNFDLKDCIEDVINIVKPMSEVNNCELSVIIPPEISTYVHSDEGLLKQVLFNLIGNAVKFTKDASVSVSLSYEGNNFMFSIKDQGVGIDEDRISMIFNKFEQADTSANRVYGGTGLGLPITKNLVSLLAGEISVVSEKGIGSEFTVTLPLSIVGREKIVKKIERTELCFEGLKNKKVLLVEDNPINALVAQSYLKKYELKISTASNGEEAIEILQEMNFDLILMDCQMPVMDGYEATENIRTMVEEGLLIDLPIIALTASAIKGDKEKCIASGMNAYLTKPIVEEELVESILFWLQSYIKEKKAS